MNGAHLHLLVNHVPVLGTIFCLPLLAYALWRKSDELKRVAFAALVLVAAGAAVAYLTGEPAEDAVKGLPGLAAFLIEPHEEVAGVALWSSIVLGGAALSALVFFRGNKQVKPWVGFSMLAGAVVVAGLMAWTALQGGKIRHTEIHSSGAATEK